MAYGFPEPREHRLPAALRAPIEARTWREFLYLLLNLPMGIIGFVFTVTMLSLGAGLLVTFLGLPVLAVMLAGCRGSASWSASGRASACASTWPRRNRCAGGRARASCRGSAAS